MRAVNHLVNVCRVGAAKQKGTFTKTFTQSSSDLSKKQTKETSVFCFVVIVGLFVGFFCQRGGVVCVSGRTQSDVHDPECEESGQGRKERA